VRPSAFRCFRFVILGGDVLFLLKSILNKPQTGPSS
jgi:hypothetical protein